MNRSTRTLVVDGSVPDPAPIEVAAQCLRDGGLVSFPTETVYGLGAVVSDRSALAAVFVAKGRPSTDPLIVHLSGAAQLDGVVASWPDECARLAERFWPGPLTMVLPRGPEIPDEVGGGRSTVGVRVPAHPVALALLAATGRPVAAPSANRFGRISPTTAQHVIDELDGRIDMVLDGGPTPLGIESTVVDLSGPTPRLLRPGGVVLEDLVDVLGEVDHVPFATVGTDHAAAAPGGLLRHYAPSIPLVLVDGGEAVLEEVSAGLRASGSSVEVVDLPRDGTAAARVLYSRLRSLDQGEADVLLARTVDPDGAGRAVNDRLFRAAHGRVVVDASPATLARLAAVSGR